MGWEVHEEYCASSTPFSDHCCAMCGRILFSSTHAGGSNNPHEIGIRGPACQVRGEVVAWDSMPLFLLLWSKQHLARTLLRGVSHYDSDKTTLTLPGGAGTAPWLHYCLGKSSANSDMPSYVRHGKPYTVDPVKPWWYCQLCYRYWIEKVLFGKLFGMSHSANRLRCAGSAPGLLARVLGLGGRLGKE